MRKIVERKRVEENLITRSFVWWCIEYPLHIQKSFFLNLFLLLLKIFERNISFFDHTIRITIRL